MKNAVFENMLYIHPIIDIQPHSDFPLHFHRHIEVSCLMEGEMEITICGNNYLLHKGDLFWVSPFMPHSYKNTTETPPNIFKLLFEPECFGVIGKIFNSYRPINPVILYSTLQKHYLNLFEKLTLLAEAFEKDTAPTDFVRNSAQLCEFLSTIVTVSGLEMVNSEANGAFIRALNFCNDNYLNNEITVASVAKNLNISLPYLNALFSQNVGLSVKEYMILLRMCHAEKLLEETKESVTEIAFTCGYNSVRSFNRAFLLTHTITPTDYRKMLPEFDSRLNKCKILSNFEILYPGYENKALNAFNTPKKNAAEVMTKKRKAKKQ